MEHVVNASDRGDVNNDVNSDVDYDGDDGGSDGDVLSMGADADHTSPMSTDGVIIGEVDVDEVKHRVSWLRSREAALAAELSLIRTELTVAEDLFAAVVNSPVANGRDPTEWLPDELLEDILLMLPFETLWSGVCERVCTRWARLVASAMIKRRKRNER
jgi:hypothetical protein